MKTDNILVSVIIPTYSRPDNICRAIDSVLAQTYKAIEIIVVDDNGEGTPHQLETAKVLDDYIKQEKIIYLKHEVNKNGSAARNTGFKASQGAFVTFLDDDDEMLPEKIEKQVDAIQQLHDEKYAMAYCGCVVDKKGSINKFPTVGSGNFCNELLLGKWKMGSGSNLLIRRDAVNYIGGYDESFARRQDIEFTIRLFRHYNIVEVHDFLLIKHNDSTPKRPLAKNYICIIEHFLNTFNGDILSMSHNLGNQVYYDQYMRLAFLAANEPDYNILIKSVQKASAYHVVSFYDSLRLVWNVLIKPNKR